MRLKGADFAEWMAEDMPASFGFETPEALPRGLNGEIPPDAVVDTAKLGRLVWREDPAYDPTGGRGLALAKRLRRWLASKDTPVLLVSRGDARTLDARLEDAGLGVRRGAAWGKPKDGGGHDG